MEAVRELFASATESHDAEVQARGEVRDHMGALGVTEVYPAEAQVGMSLAVFVLAAKAGVDLVFPSYSPLVHVVKEDSPSGKLVMVAVVCVPLDGFPILLEKSIVVSRAQCQSLGIRRFLEWVGRQCVDET